MSPGKTHALGDCGSTGQPNDHKGFGPSNAPLRPRTAPLFPSVLGDDAVEVLGPCRPAKHTLWVMMTRLIAQHGAFARGIRAGGVAGIVAPRHHMAFQGGLEGLPDECVKCKC